MSRIRTVSTALAAALTIGLLAASGASANSFLDIYQAYATTGKIDPCKYTPKQLQDARKQVPGDISQYAPDFPDALDAAAQQRAAGGCDKKAGTTATTTTAAVGAPVTTTGTTAPATPTTTAAPPAQVTTDVAPVVPVTTQPTLPDATLASSTDESGNDSTPIPLLLLAILGGLTLILGSLVAAVRWWAFDPPWLARTKHSVSEAGWRASAAWAEFTDWVRFGR